MHECFVVFFVFFLASFTHCLSHKKIKDKTAFMTKGPVKIRGNLEGVMTQRLVGVSALA